LAIDINRSKSAFCRLCIAQLKQLCHEADVTEQNFSAMRAAMVASQLRTNNVTDPRVIEAMDMVPREQFVPHERRAIAYVDVAVPLGGARALNPPMTTARLLNEAQLLPEDKLLIVGAATGYAAAVAAALVAHVTALEEDATLVAQARTALGDDSRVTIVEGPLAQGCAAGAPYDVIVIDGAVARLDERIIAQLAEGGRLVAALWDDGITRLATGRKAGESCAMVSFADVETVKLPGFDHPAAFVF
jgi:protein-L-isoaspartate(D-aspartate) O-methyltransferase